MLRKFFLALVLHVPVFASAAGLEVVSRFPSGEANSQQASEAVTVTFNQPMVALSNPEQMGSFCPLQITPAAAGRCRWMGTQTLQYQFSNPLPVGTEFRVTLPANTQSLVTQSALPQPIEWTFTTLRPQPISSRPSDQEKWISLSPILHVVFNMPMDPKRARDYMEIEGGHSERINVSTRRANEEEIKKLHYSLYDRQNISTSTVVAIKPERPLQKGQFYSLVLKAGLPGAVGNIGMKADSRIRFRTYEEFAAASPSTPPCIPGSMTMFFTNPVLRKDFLSHFRLDGSTTAFGGDESDTWDGARGANGVGLPFPDHDWNPDQEYSFTITKGLSDIFGQKLAQDYHGVLRTPGFCTDIDMPKGFGILESYLSPRHPVSVLNIQTVPIEMKRIATEDLIPFAKGINFWERGVQPLEGSMTLEWQSKAPRNKRWRTYLDLNTVLKGKGGFVFSQVENRFAEQEWRRGWDKALDNVTSLGLTFKNAPDSTLLWVTHLKTGAPAAGVPVQLRDDDNRVLWNGKTDSKGFADAPGNLALKLKRVNVWERPRLWAFAFHPTGDAALSSQWREGLEPWRFNLPYSYGSDSQYRATLFTDRGVYRPGERVYFKGIVRKLVQGEWQASDKKDLLLVLHDSRGTEVWRSSITLSENSSFDESYTVGEEAPTGNWTVRVVEADGLVQKPLVAAVPNEEGEGEGEDVNSESNPGTVSFSAYFRVEAFKPATFEVKATPDQSAYESGDTFKAVVEGWYLFGAPMAEGKVDWKLRMEPLGGFTPPGWETYDFWASGWNEPEQRGGKLLASKIETLDSKGRISISEKLDDDAFKGPSAVMLEASAMSPDRQRLFGRALATVHASKVYLGLKSDKSFLEFGKPWSAQIIAVQPDGKALPGQKIDVEVIRRDWLSVQRAGFGGRLEWSSEQRDTVISSASFTSTKDPYLWQMTPEKPGYYFCKVTTLDEKKRRTTSEKYFYVIGKGESWWARSDNDLLELVPDKTSYKPGDTARILVKSPYGNSRALVTVEREGILDRWITTLDGGAAFVNVPIKENYLPNMYVGVMLVQGRTGTGKFEKESGEDIAKPEAKFGYAAISVDPGGRKLSVRVKTNKDQYRPREKVDVFLTATDESGKPVQGELTVYAVDEGVLSLTAYATPDPFPYFYGSRSLAVETVDSRLHIIGQRSYGEKGEGRGGGGGSMAGLEGIDLRSRFVPTAYWNGSVKTDASGKARVSFTLPDNLSRFRVMAVAHTARRFGSGDSRFTVSKPFLARPSLPRFARVGDSFEGGLVLQNYTSAPVKATIHLELTGTGIALEKGEARREVNIASGKAVEVLWTCKATGLGEAVFKFRAAAGSETDGLEWKVPVKPYERMETVATTGVVEKTGREEIAPPGVLSVNDKLVLSLSPTALAGLEEGARYLLDYPYGCLEQRMSRMLPVIVGADLIQTFGLGTIDGLKKDVQKQLDRLNTYQRPGGGFSYWTDGIHPDPYLTAYALEVSTLAAREGYRVPHDTLEKAAGWLKTYLSSRQQWAYPYSESEDYAARAYAVYVLGMYGQLPSNYFTQLYAVRHQLPYLGKAYLLKASRYATRDPQIAKELTQDLLNQAKVAPETMHFEDPGVKDRWWIHDSTVKTTAVALQAMLETRGGFPQDEKVIQWLTSERKAKGRWRSTQENALSLWAFEDFYRRYEKDEPKFTASVVAQSKNGSRELFKETFTGRTLTARQKSLSLMDVLGNAREASLGFTKTGMGRLYYTLRMRYTAAALKVPVSEGFEVERSVTPLYGSDKNLKAGARAVVTLKVRTKQDRPFVALDDPLPGGFEIVDTTFATESQEDATATRSSGPYGPYWGTFQRSEKYDDRMLIFADYLESGEHTYSYLIQATTPGRFHAPAAGIEQMYEPSVFGRTASTEVEIKK